MNVVLPQLELVLLQVQISSMHLITMDPLDLSITTNRSGTADLYKLKWFKNPRQKIILGWVTSLKVTAVKNSAVGKEEKPCKSESRMGTHPSKVQGK